MEKELESQNFGILNDILLSLIKQIEKEVKEKYFWTEKRTILFIPLSDSGF